MLMFGWSWVTSVLALYDLWLDAVDVTTMSKHQPVSSKLNQFPICTDQSFNSLRCSVYLWVDLFHVQSEYDLKKHKNNKRLIVINNVQSRATIDCCQKNLRHVNVFQISKNDKRYWWPTVMCPQTNQLLLTSTN